MAAGIDAENTHQVPQETETRLRDTFDQAAIGIAHADLEGRWIVVNPRLCEMLGYSGEQLLGRPIEEIIHPGDRPSERQRRERLVSERFGPIATETRLVCADGSFLWVERIASVVRNSQDAPLYILEFIEDIDARKRSEREIERRASQQEAVAQFGLRALSGGDGQALLNEAVELVARTLGVEYCEVLERCSDSQELLLRAGVGWREGLVGSAKVGGDRDSQAGFTLLSNAPVIVKDLNAESRFVGPPLLKDHGVVSGVTVVIRGADQPWGVMGAHSAHRRGFNQDDIHFVQSIANILAMAIERKRVEESVVRHQADMEALNDRLQRAMRETHHRVKNNLQIISAMVDLRLMQYDSQVPTDEFRRLGAYVRTLATVHDILTEEAKQGGRRESISALTVLEKLLPLLQTTAGGRQIRYSMDELWLPARQATALAIVINELISNALKHSKDDVDLTLRIVGKSATLQVCDNGPGFPQGFNPTKAAHTGLELVDSLSRWDLGGQTEYGNRPEGGACARITIPLPTPAQVEQRTHHRAESLRPPAVRSAPRGMPSPPPH